MERVRVAVVGGGSVATSFIFHLVRARQSAQSAVHELDVLVFESNETIGRGAAYANDADTNLLNVTAGSMSIAEDDRLHFFRWLQRHSITHFNGTEIAHDSFLPRPLFGQYLEDVYQETCAIGTTLGVHIRHIRETVLDVEAGKPNGYKITTDKQRHLAEHVVLSIGNLASNTFETLRGEAGYFDSPYPVRTLVKGIAADATVCVLGTSLSAIDAVVALVDAGHTGQVYCVSRNGRLPSVRGLKNRSVTLSPRLLAALSAGNLNDRQLTLSEAIRLLADEMTHHGIDFSEVVKLQAPPPNASSYLDEEISLSSTRPRQWQSLGNALNAVVDAIWQQLDDLERERFDATLRSIWMARRVTFPIENAKKLQALLRTEQLQVQQGFQSVKPNSESGRQYSIKLQDGSEIEADVIVNATSFSADTTRSNSPLLRGLLSRGDAVPHRFGGLAVDFASGNLIRSDGSVDAGISVLGTMSAGTYFWTNAMDVNARLARGVAERLVRTLSKSWRQAECAA
ncbi:FAD/NAD(P)-binding protein [Comamonas thiooxydans]|uniref:Hydroxyacylglutathione hydrolase n=3 Tax=Comamonas thiooxydans TaxID=363952 RepID=A0A0E3CEJ6_9BURK|nr:FAD/NAD(P)-binding protein [Comamonas thiooxydans]KGH08576.1 hydroxyacylglutathione hydrolase [Comamonas thiooxydans]KGH15207.1 hydroxyacylglutathione hydrolase [Comamonas thiooxydans]KGH20332.1 hydroxyacylglutathione hydrolase [Comamonas thiooxydans]CUA92994.1 Uncharacterized NAD(P)/FAD-binding protein YdhS [Comamonas thiooxydans]